jgi:kynurenine 3-monooxygenase
MISGKQNTAHKAKLLEICSLLIALSHKIIKAQKNCIIEGILALEQQHPDYPAQLTQLADQYQQLFQEYSAEIDKLHIALATIRDNHAPIVPNINQKNVVIVGGGLTGIVLSAFLAKQGLAVTVYDALPDPREVKLTENRSINITLCERGLAPLRNIGAYDAVLKACVPAKGRKIHNTDGNLTTQYYGNQGESLYSISRHELSKTLLEYVAKQYKVDFHFAEKCFHINPDDKRLTFINKETQQLSTITADVIIGADGGQSKVRQTLQDHDPTFKVDKSKHQHAYKEVKLQSPPPHISGNMNYLHIWPRDNFMLIGFPNTDNTMTLSLHLPEKGQGNSLENIQSAADYHEFFKRHFPDIYKNVRNVCTQCLG